MAEKVVVFGLGELFKTFIMKNEDEYEIVFFSDNDPAKIGMNIRGIKVISPNQICNIEYDKILVTSVHYSEICKQLHQYGIPLSAIIQYGNNDSEQNEKKEN